MQKPLRFIISIFGNRHANMLLPLLHSIEKSNPEAKASIYWEDIDREKIDLFSKNFPFSEWIETNFNFSKEVTKRIASKTLILEQAAHDNKERAEWLAFIDADVLVIKNVLNFIQNIETDGILTDRDVKFPINSGVMIFQSGDLTAQFFSLWREETMNIVNTPSLFALANDTKQPYGAADQMSLHRILTYSREQRDYAVAVNNQTMRIHMADCLDLNETYSVPISDRTRIIHYKGGWRSILFEKGIFTKNRSKEDSWEMLIYYIRCFQQATQEISKRSSKDYTLEDFGFSVPSYIDKDTLTEKPYAYPLHKLFWKIKTFFPRLRIFIKERFFSKK